jgi:hypothetical protein
LSVTVQASKHPLKPEWVYADVAANQSIYEISGGAPVAAFINGREVPEELHRLTRVKDNTTLVLWPVPQGGAEDVLKSVASVVVAAAAAYVAVQTGIPFLGIKAGSFGAYAAGAAIGLAGNYAINTLIPPPTPAQPQTQTPESFNRLESITGTSNQVAAFKPIPRLYGTFRFFPPIPMTARPYTEVSGDDQYLRMFLCLGYGPIEIGGKKVGAGYSKLTEQDALSGAPLKIGETDLGQFDEVEYEIGTPDQMTLYSDQIIEIDPAFSSDKNDDGVSAVRTTEPNTDEISIGLAGRLFSVNDKAKTRNGTVRWRIEYREVGTSTWIVEEENFVISSSKKETIREGFRWRVDRGQYEVRLTRKSTSFGASTNTVADFAWNALRSIRSVQPFDVDGTVCMAMRIKSTDQLNGRIDDLSVLATSVLDAYDGSSWSPKTTNNPAWVYADIWTGEANRRPLEQSDLDADALLEWANYCDAEGFEYNGVFDSAGTTFERATEVAGTGLANWNFSADAKIGVVRDIVQSIPKMIISPRNSFGFNYELAAVEVPDALRVRFVDELTFENTERLVFDDGFDESNAEKFETLEAKGVTDPDQAWKFGRYHIAQQRLRPERYNFKQDVQHLRYTRGDMLTIQYDTILVGIAAGRIKEAVSNREIVLDEIVVDDGEEYGVKIQHSDGSISVVGCRLGEGPLNQTVLLNSDVDKVSPDDLVIFGELGKESIDVKVTAIEPEGDFVAGITTVPAADEIEQAFEGDVPAFDPVLTEPVSPDQTTPRIPDIENIRSDENVLYVDDDGSLRVRMVVSTALTSFPGWDQKTQIRFRPVGDTSFETLEPTRSTNLSVFDVDEGIEYEVQVRGVKNGLFSAWSDPQKHTVIGKSTPPPNVEQFQAVQNGESVVFRWQEITTTPDIEGYEVRYGPRGKATFNNSIKVAETTKTNVVTEADIPPGDFRFFCKAIDTAGNFSQTAAQIDLVVKTEFELLEQTSHEEDWEGTGYYVGFEDQNGSLVATNNEEAYYVTDEVDLGFDAENVRVWGIVDASLEIYDEVDDQGSVAQGVQEQENYLAISDSVTVTEDYGELDVALPISDPRILYEISTRNTDENLNGFDSAEDYGSVAQAVSSNEDHGLITEPLTSSESYDTLVLWRPWTRGEVDARFVRQRVKIKRRPGEEGLKILRAFTSSVDVNERTEKQQGLTIDPGGSTFQFDRRFHLKPTVTGTVESDQDLFPIRKNLDTNSVTFVVRDSAGNDVGADNFDFIAIGA